MRVSLVFLPFGRLELTAFLDVKHMALDAVSFGPSLIRSKLTPSSSAVMNAARALAKARYPLSSADPNLQMLSCNA